MRRRAFKKLLGVFGILGLLGTDCFAGSVSIEETQIEDFGIRGQTFPIQEKSLLEVIQGRVAAAEKSGKIKKLNAQFKKRVQEKVLSPSPVQGVGRTQNPRTFYFDPTITCEKDIFDHLGRVVVAKGTKANPLETLDWGIPLLFVDGSDAEQIAWALRETGKIVLVKGRPMDLKKEHGGWFFFDQGGALCRKFGIIQVPAKVSQEGLKLKIEEKKP